MCKKFLFYSRKSHQSRQKLRAIFREIREREIITLVYSSDAARRRPYSHHSLLKTCPYVLLYNIRRHYRVDGHPELVSGSVRGERQEKARGEMLKRVQHDIWSHLLFILSFWGSQFNTYV